MWEALQTLWADLPAIEAKLRAGLWFRFGDDGFGLWSAAILHGAAPIWAATFVYIFFVEPWLQARARQKNKRRY